MSEASLRFEELQVRRAPGFDAEGFRLRELSPGINIIHGPNGSGKSTTARSVARLLWPKSVGESRESLRGRFRLGEEEWIAEVDGSRVRYWRNGVEASAPHLPPGEGHQRYHLSLHDLLRERDSSFAAVIARESAGGFDVRASGAKLEPRAPTSRRNALNEALNRAREEYDAAVARHRELRAKERELAELRSQFREADAAQRRMGLLEAALEHAQAREREAVTRAALARFPAAMEHVAGDEFEQLCRLRDSLRRNEEARRDAEKAAEHSRMRMAELALPDEALREDLVPALEEDFARLETALREVERASAAHARALARRDAEAQRLGAFADPERLSAVDLAGISNVAEFARRVNALASRRNALESQLRLLNGSPLDQDAARVDEGIRLLRCWLREPPPAAPETKRSGWKRMAGGAAAVALVGVGAILALGLHPPYLAILLLGLTLLMAIFWPSASPPAGADAREVHRREYEKLGLGGPASWDPRGVETLLTKLEERGLAARQAVIQQARRRELEEDLAGLAAAEREIEEERVRIVSRLGVVPPDTAPIELAWITEAISRWQAAHAEVVAEEAVLRAAEERAGEIEDSLRTRLEPLGYHPLTTVGELSTAIRALQERRQTLRSENERLRNAEATLRRLAEERRTREEEIQRLFDSLGLEAGSDETVRVWCEQRPHYRQAYDAHRRAESVVEAARVRLEGLGVTAEVMSRPAHELRAEIELEAQRASRRDQLASEITATETLINDAKRSHSVEEALERVQRAEEDLRRAREKEARSAIAEALIDALERATRDQHLPAVFRRARELFSRITHARYELRLRQEREPEFTAFDRIDRQERRLEELSSGTRVQLLLSVRVAFVEQQEQGVRLPLLLDEVLGNSDDERARAIMEAAVELAREGRQIFYFTAQGDEVARWRGIASEGLLAGIEFREIDLAEVRGAERRLVIPPAIPFSRRLPPHPGGDDHARYGRRLGVPRLDRTQAEVTALHLWYLLDDPKTLHRLLSLGPERWGPLRALVRNGGRALVDERLARELEAKGRVAEAFLEAVGVGVGRRVDRVALEESGAVGTTFLDRVDDLARSLEGNAARIMEALEAGAVPRFGTKRKQALRSFFEEGGYLPQQAPLSREEIRQFVLSRAAGDLARGTITIDQLEGLLARLWLGIEGGDLISRPEPARTAPA